MVYAFGLCCTSHKAYFQSCSASLFCTDGHLLHCTCSWWLWRYLASSGSVRTVMRHESTYLADCKGELLPRRKGNLILYASCISYICACEALNIELASRLSWPSIGAFVSGCAYIVIITHKSPGIGCWLNCLSRSELPCKYKELHSYEYFILNILMLYFWWSFWFFNCCCLMLSSV